MALTKPQFIDRDVEQIIRELIAQYELETGKVLQPAQVERLLMNAFAYREGLVRQSIQDAALQNLVEFSSAPVLDYLGELVGVKRLGANPAKVNITFSLSLIAFTETIPAGTRVASSDGKVIFETIEAKQVSIPATSVVVECQCQTLGTVGNGYTAGTINNLLDTKSWLTGATNAAVSGNGSNEETDDQLRERIKLAPASFSNAGSRGAYKYWAFTASADIVDVYITSSTPGTVNVYPLVSGGNITSTATLNAVTAALNDEKVRPLTDTVVVAAPTRTTISVEMDVTTLVDYDAADVQARMLESLNAFAVKKYSKLGQDITESQILAAAMVEGVYKIEWPSPWSDIVAGPNEFIKITDFVINLVGTSNG